MGPRSTDSPTYQSPCKGANEAPGEGNNSCENSCSVATPSSVHLIGSPLNRELSDLSGSYVSGSPLPSSVRGGVPRNIFGSPRESPLTIRQPWRQAHSLSSPAPDMMHGPKMPILSSSGVEEMIMVERNGGVEVLPPNSSESAALDAFENGTKDYGDRCPVVIILMNPAFKTYELMQLWLDTKTDTVRDVLQTLRQSIPNTWNQDYDGLAQFRRDRLSQLINCLRTEQFAVVPHEIWVAKPWALAADKTARYAENLLEHLKMVGVVNSTAVCDYPPRVGDAPVAGDGVMTLSAEAQRRVYSPDGILTHHHAIQYLSFGPPFEKPFDRPPIFPSSVAVANRRTTSPTAPRTNSPNSYVAPLPPPTSYKEIDLQTGEPQSRCLSPALRSISPMGYSSASQSTSPALRSPSPMEYSSASSSASKSPGLSTDGSTSDESQNWDNGTVKMAYNDGNLRESFRKIASQCEVALNRKLSSPSRSSKSGNTSSSLKHLRSCFSALNCGKRAKEEPVIPERRHSSEEFTTLAGSTYSLSFGNEENSLGQQNMSMTLFEIDEEESMEDMPLLGSRKYLDDEFMG